VEGQISHAANKYGFRLKGLVRCGECGSAVSSYVRPKKEKVYRYYKCLAKLNGLPVKCGFTSIGAQKIEEFVIEKLAALGWNRPFLERLVRKERELSRGRMEPLKLEREQTETRLATIRKGIGNLVTLARDSNSQEVREELSRLDVSKKTLEARLIDLQAEIGYCGKLVYDVNMVEATLRHFARHIYRIPIQLQIQTIQRMVKRVVLFKNKVQVELYELPVENIQQSMGTKIIEGEIKNSKVRIPPRSKGTSIIPPSGGTAVVEVEQNWRGRRGRNQTALMRPFVPSLCKTHYIPSFELVWTFKWRRITDGEKVVDEAPTVLDNPARSLPPILSASNFKSRRSLRRQGQFQTYRRPFRAEAGHQRHAQP